MQLYPVVHKLLNCHGLGQCGSCRVLITKGMENTSRRGLLESARMAVSLAYIGNEKTMRLACQTKVNGDITVETTPPLNLFGENFLVRRLAWSVDGQPRAYSSTSLLGGIRALTAACRTGVGDPPFQERLSRRGVGLAS